MTEKMIPASVLWYNDIMNQIGYEHKTIGEPLSEGTEGWNLRDMVAEMDYVLSCYYEEGHCMGDMRYSEDPDERKAWRNETGRMKRFLKRYRPQIVGMICTAGHCSKYDNSRERKEVI